MGSGDLNKVKKLEKLAVAENSSFVVISSALIQDMHGNDVVAIPSTEAQPVDAFVADKVRPSVVGFSLNMNGTAKLQLTFSEVIEPSSVVVDAIALQGLADVGSAAAVQSQSLNSSAGSFLELEDDVVLTIPLGFWVTNQLKKKLDLATNKESTYLVARDTLVKDMNGNDVDVIQTSAALPVDTLVLDTTRPELVSFDVNLNPPATLAMTFTETVNASSIDVRGITFEANASPSTAEYWELTEGVLQSTMDEYHLSLLLSDTDLNKLKYKALLATAPENTFIKLTSHSVADVSTNPLVATHKRVQNFVADETRPEMLLSLIHI